MRLTLTVFLVILFTGSIAQPFLRATNSRSDTADITNYSINLEITDFAGKKINGFTEVSFLPKITSLNYLNLDLLALNIDSIVFNSQKLNFSYDDTLLHILFPTDLVQGQNQKVKIFYNGTPKIDPSSYGGGFYITSGYAYNVGVGFDSDPHVLGRAWFPCFDNFVERSTYDFHITVTSSNKAYCNGNLTGITDIGNGKSTWNWKLDQQIPTYLASVAVAPYASLNYTFNGLNGPMPVVLNALAADTLDLKKSFVNLSSAFSIYENAFGPDRFPRIGYNIVPIIGGAMEHPTNIAYGLDYIDGTINYETTMAHELSHHWWGDLVTCQTQEDMWLNEGFASYCEYLFLEKQYGMARYKAELRGKHKYMLQYMHHAEEDYRAVSGVPHKYTYGQHVYDKGASVVHNLRSYLGDSLFFGGLKAFLVANEFSDISSAELRDFLSNYSGKDLYSFFENWVFSGGFPHFSIDSIKISQSGSTFNAEIIVEQKLTGASKFYTGVPLTIGFMDSKLAIVERSIIINGAYTSGGFNLDFSPVAIFLNLDEKITDAITFNAVKINKTGAYSVTDGMVSSFNVTEIQDSAYIKLEHNWTTPDGLKGMKKYRLSPNRFWKFSGYIPGRLKATARLYFYSSVSSHLDDELIGVVSKDSLVLLYRANQGLDWAPYPYSTKKTGYFILDSILTGEYVFAMKDSVLYGGLDVVRNSEGVLKVFPNPNNGEFNFEIPVGFSDPVVEIFDLTGKLVKQRSYIGHGLFRISLSNEEKGLYFIRARKENKMISSRLILE